MQEFLDESRDKFGPGHDVDKLIEILVKMSNIFLSPLDLGVYFNTNARRAKFLAMYGLGNNALQFLEVLSQNANEMAWDDIARVQHNRFCTQIKEHTGLGDVDPLYSLAERLFGKEYVKQSGPLAHLRGALRKMLRPVKTTKKKAKTVIAPASRKEKEKALENKVTVQCIELLQMIGPQSSRYTSLFEGKHVPTASDMTLLHKLFFTKTKVKPATVAQ